MRSRRAAWGAALMVLTLGWLSGYALWHTDAVGEGYGTVPFAPGETLVIALVALTGFLSAGLLLRSTTVRWTRLGWIALAGTTLLIGYALSFTWFGGICLDPGDVCLLTWPSQAGPAVGAFAALAIGAVSSEWRRGRPTRP